MNDYSGPLAQQLRSLLSAIMEQRSMAQNNATPAVPPGVPQASADQIARMQAPADLSRLAAADPRRRRRHPLEQMGRGGGRGGFMWRGQFRPYGSRANRHPLAQMAQPDLVSPFPRTGEEDYVGVEPNTGPMNQSVPLAYQNPMAGGMASRYVPPQTPGILGVTFDMGQAPPTGGIIGTQYDDSLITDGNPLRGGGGGRRTAYRR